MSDAENAVALRRRQLLQAGSAGLAATVVPGCVGAVGGEPNSVSVDGSAPRPSEVATEDASPALSPRSPDVVGEPSMRGAEGGSPNQDLPGTGTNSTKGGADAASSETASSDAGSTGAASTCAPSADAYVLSLADHPELSSTGGSAVFSDPRYSDPICGMGGFYIVKTRSGQYAAFSTGCTHDCCEVEVQDDSVFCPCHGSRFDLMTGQVTAGPARNNLPSLPISTDGSCVRIQLT